MPLRAETIAENGLVAIVRLDDLSAAVPLTEALIALVKAPPEAWSSEEPAPAS